MQNFKIERPNNLNEKIYSHSGKNIPTFQNDKYLYFLKHAPRNESGQRILRFLLPSRQFRCFAIILFLLILPMGLLALMIALANDANLLGILVLAILPIFCVYALYWYISTWRTISHPIFLDSQGLYFPYQLPFKIFWQDIEDIQSHTAYGYAGVPHHFLTINVKNKGEYISKADWKNKIKLSIFHCIPRSSFSIKNCPISLDGWGELDKDEFFVILYSFWVDNRD